MPVFIAMNIMTSGDHPLHMILEMASGTSGDDVVVSYSMEGGSIMGNFGPKSKPRPQIPSSPGSGAGSGSGQTGGKK